MVMTMREDDGSAIKWSEGHGGVHTVGRNNVMFGATTVCPSIDVLHKLLLFVLWPTTFTHACTSTTSLSLSLQRLLLFTTSTTAQCIYPNHYSIIIVSTFRAQQHQSVFVW